MSEEISYEPRPIRRGATARLLPVAVVIGGLAMGAAGVAVAQDATSTPTPKTAPTAGATAAPDADGDEKVDGRKGHRGRGHGPGGRGMGGMHRALHGEFTVEQGDGVYQSVATQRGTVTAVSPTSIAVESEDGYTRVYVVTADTLVSSERDGIESVETGEEVAVMATVEGDQATAVRIHDLAAKGELHDRMHPDAEKRAPQTEGSVLER